MTYSFSSLWLRGRIVRKGLKHIFTLASVHSNATSTPTCTAYMYSAYNYDYDIIIISTIVSSVYSTHSTTDLPSSSVVSAGRNVGWSLNRYCKVCKANLCSEKNKKPVIKDNCFSTCTHCIAIYKPLSWMPVQVWHRTSLICEVPVSLPAYIVHVHAHHMYQSYIWTTVEHTLNCTIYQFNISHSDL